jgi:hypothetical protein
MWCVFSGLFTRTVKHYGKWMNKSMEHLWRTLTKCNQNTWWKTCLSATLCTPNPKYTALGLNPDLCSDKPLTHHLNVTHDKYAMYVVITALDMKKPFL